MRTFDATRLRTFREIELPAALPGHHRGEDRHRRGRDRRRVAEWSGASSGLGYLFQPSLPQLLTARAYACIVVLSVFAIVLFALLGIAERALLPWSHQSTT
jgi:putative hydroxymethylpyrimidine transport system permease protein